MTKFTKRVISVVLALITAISCVLMGTAENKTVFADGAYATIVTASDFQRYDLSAYNRFGKILNLAKNDGMPTPDALLIGGDYTMVLLDDAVPGISRIRNTLLSAYPEADPRSVICIQGNHDNPKEEFTETGFYNMGAFCLYVINEDDFPWKQHNHSDKGVKAVAKDIEACLNQMIESGDKRPVIVLTHVPLHHTDRNKYGDNMYASYIFNVLNEKAKQLDIVFLFGHNHSNDCDDYIGGSVNFMAPGEKIRIPLPDKRGEDCYTEETLNFTYTNCGYMGYSNNSKTETSTDALTMGTIQLTNDTLRFVRYSENGVYSINEVGKVNRNEYVSNPEFPELDDKCICHSENPFLKFVWKIWTFMCRITGLNHYCTCGKAHY